MHTRTQPRFTKRYQRVSEAKAGGSTYTPAVLANFVAEQMMRATVFSDRQETVRILDPAVGDGALLLSLLTALQSRTQAPVAVFGFDTNPIALDNAHRQISAAFPDADLYLEQSNFLDSLLQYTNQDPLFPIEASGASESFDLIIANPPYVRTQIMGAHRARRLASVFGLTGRVDLYHAFLIGMAQVLRPGGVAGIIVSNRFMTTRAGASVRTALRERFALRHIWDLGDTRLFDAAVLPAVILAEGRNGQKPVTAAFSSIYETGNPATSEVSDPMEALGKSGIVALCDGRRFHVQHGTLPTSDAVEDVWRIATQAGDSWLATVAAHSWGNFRDIGKIRVGVKTCADKIFIRSDWPEQLELLRPVTTHHTAGRFRAIPAKQPKLILYPHTVIEGRRQVADLAQYPKTRAYLEAYRDALEARTYVIEGGRHWYELWVPQDPALWSAPKLVFRDIAARPTFWLDTDGTIVNGDCYWITSDPPGNEDLLWLAAAVANSTFAEAFYDHRFNNKLYAGRRRFMTQYVEQFPLPDPKTALSCEIIAMAKAIYSANHSPQAKAKETQLNRMIWTAFGLSAESRTICLSEGAAL